MGHWRDEGHSVIALYQHGVMLAAYWPGRTSQVVRLFQHGMAGCGHGGFTEICAADRDAARVLCLRHAGLMPPKEAP